MNNRTSKALSSALNKTKEVAVLEPNVRRLRDQYHHSGEVNFNGWNRDFTDRDMAALGDTFNEAKVVEYDSAKSESWRPKVTFPVNKSVAVQLYRDQLG